MAQFFIDRPIFAWVIAILIMMAGVLSIPRLPISQYPAIAPPSISVSAGYPGASAKTLEDTVTQVIEQRMNGLDDLRYMTSSSDSAGAAQVTLTFDAGTDPDIAQVQVQNKLQLAMPQLPQEVQRQGVRVAKSVRNFLLIVGLRLRGRQHDPKRHRGLHRLLDAAGPHQPRPRRRRRASSSARSTRCGSGSTRTKLADYRHDAARRRRPRSRPRTPRSRPASSAARRPSQGQQLNATITAQTRLQTAEQFRAILLRVNPDGSQVRLGDVARVELAGESFEIETFINGRRPSGIGVRLAAGANALAHRRRRSGRGSTSSRPTSRPASR